MDSESFEYSVASPKYMNVSVQDIENSSFSDSSSSSSLSTPPIPRVKKLLQPDPDDIADDLKEEMRQCINSGNCDLSQLLLYTIPTGLPLESLTSLILSENQLTEIPAYMFENKNCINLVKFDASSNNLKEVPKNIFTLPKLEVLLLDHNEIEVLALENMKENGKGVLLPSLKTLGLEFNNLKKFPIEFFINCSFLEMVFLGQNEDMLDEPIPTELLLQSAVTQRWINCEEEEEDYYYYYYSNENKVTLKLDNRPRLIKQMEEENWETKLPWLKIELHKIYPDKVLGFLFLGSLRTAQTKSVYHDLNIGYILTVVRDMEVVVEPGMKHLVLPVDDLPGEDLRPLFHKAFKFIDEAKKENKGVLLHCFAGLSRSVAVTAAYIMNRYNMKRDEALDLIKKARPAAQPNPGFMIMLKEYEKQLEQERNGE